LSNNLKISGHNPLLVEEELMRKERKINFGAETNNTS